MNCIIVGNSGSGKSWIAKRISHHFGTKLIHLDELFWSDSKFKNKRDSTEIELMIENGLQRDRLNEQSWVVEGVYSHLVKNYVDDADLFILLDVEWELCRKRLINRNSLRENESDLEFQKLLNWASMYKDREDVYSCSAHQSLFDYFKKKKYRIETEDEVDQLLKELQIK